MASSLFNPLVNKLGQLPTSMLTRPGANQNPGAGLGNSLSDVASTGGYGSTVNYPDYSNPAYTYALPGVLPSLIAQLFQGGMSDTQTTQGLQNAAIEFGDPTAFATGPARIYPGLTSEHGNNAAPWQNLSGYLGYNVDPATAALARSNTVGQNGTFGHSIVAQLQLAAQKSLQNAVDKGIPLGSMGSGQLGYGVNQANIANSQHLYDATKAFQDYTQGLINNNLTTHTNLNTNTANAIIKGVTSAFQHPTAYSLPVPTAAPVGGTIGLPKTPYGAGQAAPKPITPNYNGPH